MGSYVNNTMISVGVYTKSTEECHTCAKHLYGRAVRQASPVPYCTLKGQGTI